MPLAPILLESHWPFGCGREMRDQESREWANWSPAPPGMEARTSIRTNRSNRQNPDIFAKNGLALPLLFLGANTGDATMIRLREITGQENQLGAFVAHYASAGGFPLDITYARRCRAFAFTSKKGKMFGGFLINIAPPFRSLNDMPAEECARILGELDLNETFEAMCFWFAREMRGSMKMMIIWAELLYFLKKFPRQDMLGCTVWKSLLKQYSVVPFDVLYEGKIQTSTRILDKYVFLCRGKKGFAQGVVREGLRRVKKRFVDLWNPQSAKRTLPSTNAA
jgi:hypothetical protein